MSGSPIVTKMAAFRREDAATFDRMRVIQSALEIGGVMPLGLFIRIVQDWILVGHATSRILFVPKSHAKTKSRVAVTRGSCFVEFYSMRRLEALRYIDLNTDNDPACKALPAAHQCNQPVSC